MVPTAEYSTHVKETVIWALAWKNPDFAAFYAEYQEEIALAGPLPTEFVDRVVEAVGQDPDLAPVAKHYFENAEAAATFAVPGLPEAGILIAAMFLLGTHIKFHRTENGKWEFLLEHPVSDSGTLEKIVQILSELFKR